MEKYDEALKCYLGYYDLYKKTEALDTYNLDEFETKAKEILD